MELIYQPLGLVDYPKAWQAQKQWIQWVWARNHPGVLVSCRHWPVVTVGVKGQAPEYLHWSGPVYFVERGGKATYHGPQQVVIYPLINLNHPQHRFFFRDVARWLFFLEKWLVDFLWNKFQISAWGGYSHYQRGSQPTFRTGPVTSGLSFTGIWTQKGKIASIGIAIKKWVSYHGIALNVNHDESFYLIQPCGFQPQIITSLEDILTTPLSMDWVEAHLVQSFITQLQEAPKE